MTTPPLDAVIFDAGGILVRLDFEWMAETIGSLGHRVDAATLRRAEVEGRRRFDASGERAGAGEAPPLGKAGDVRAYFGGTLEAAGVPAAVIEGMVDRMLARERDRGLWARPMEGAREAIDGVLALGLRTAVVSNSDGRAERHLESSGVRRGIGFVIDSHVVGIEKPDPRIFALALERLGVEPARALFVGDIRSVDERGARAAGLRFVLLDPSGDYAGPGTDAIRAIAELPGWIAERFEAARAGRA